MDWSLTKGVRTGKKLVNPEMQKPVNTQFYRLLIFFVLIFAEREGTESLTQLTDNQCLKFVERIGYPNFHPRKKGLK
jgi:hypothetical protein